MITDPGGSGTVDSLRWKNPICSFEPSFKNFTEHCISSQEWKASHCALAAYVVQDLHPTVVPHRSMAKSTGRCILPESSWKNIFFFNEPTWSTHSCFLLQTSRRHIFYQ
jgi:hypothetical protein